MENFTYYSVKDFANRFEQLVACKESINKAKIFVDEIELVSKDPDNFTYE